MVEDNVLIHYRVESHFWRRKIGNKLDNLIKGIDFSDALVKTKQEFEHESPIEARKMAFNHYQSIVDVLCDGLYKKYSSDKQARIDLQYYLDSGNTFELPKLQTKISDDIFNGINIYMVVDKPLVGIKVKSKNKYCLHGINYHDTALDEQETLIDNLENLLVESKYYEEYGLSARGNQVLKHFGQIGGDAEFFLQTPFDWDILMNEFEGENLLKNGRL